MGSHEIACDRDQDPLMESVITGTYGQKHHQEFKRSTQYILHIGVVFSHGNLVVRCSQPLSTRILSHVWFHTYTQWRDFDPMRSQVHSIGN